MPLAPFYLIALALIGLGDTFYLAYSVWSGVAPSCLLEGCETVLAHPLSKVFGVPLAYFGVVFYTYLLGLAVLLAKEPFSKALTQAAALYTAVGLVCSAIFIYEQGFIIGAFCQYCVLSAVITLIAFGVALWHIRSTRAQASV